MLTRFLCAEWVALIQARKDDWFIFRHRNLKKRRRQEGEKACEPLAHKVSKRERLVFRRESLRTAYQHWTFVLSATCCQQYRYENPEIKPCQKKATKGITLPFVWKGRFSSFFRQCKKQIATFQSRSFFYQSVRFRKKEGISYLSASMSILSLFVPVFLWFTFSFAPRLSINSLNSDSLNSVLPPSFTYLIIPVDISR